MSRRKEYGKFYTIKICTKCEKRFSDKEIYHSMGTCVHCGNTVKSAIVDYRKIIVRKVTEYTLIKFIGGLRFKKDIVTTYEGAREEDDQWLSNLNKKE